MEEARSAAFDSARMLVPRLCRVAAMARHFFGQEFSPVGNGLQLFMDLVAVPAGGPQMTNGCLAFRHRHTAGHLSQLVADSGGAIKLVLERFHSLCLSHQRQLLL